MCEEKKRKQRWEKEMKEAKTNEQVWKIVNRERKRIKEGIEMREWEKYFTGLLGE